ncbi:MAG: hypothetical protein Q9178_003554 [Gyalolechia marmorata]
MADTTQQLEEDDCITPRQSTTIALRYPSLPVTGTPDSWLSRSLLVSSMASTQDEGSVRSNDDTMSSLGDSAYDFIDDNSVATTDDEEMGLIGRTSSAERIRGSPDDEDLERTLSTGNLHPRSSKGMKQVAMQSSLYSSTSEEDMFCRKSPGLLQQQAPNQQVLPSIKFRDIHHGEGAFLLDPVSAPQNLAVYVRQHMLDRTLSLEGPYRVLYVGDVAARERIVAKIGAALTSTAKEETFRPLRYSVVPMPSSDDPAYFSEPVLLDWSGHEIVVYQCVNASFGRKDSGHDLIKLTMDGDVHVQSFWDGSKFNLTEGWELPDISIVYLSEGDGVSAKQTRRLARSFVARHKIPTIVVSDRPAWERPSEAMTIERLTPHICLQTKSDTAAPSSVIKRLPIDLSTLMRIDALQLNQNLAYLAAASGTSRASNEGKQSLNSRGRSSFDKGPNVRPTWEAFQGFIGAARPGFLYLLGFLAAVSIYMTCSFIVTQLSPFSTRLIDPGPNSNISCSNAPTLLSPGVATPVASSNSKSAMSQSLNIISPAKLGSSQRFPAEKSYTDLATLLESTPMTINKSEKFQVHVLGDAHIVLRPPHWFTRLRRTPKLNINVTQNDRILKHQLSILFDGVYALELPIEEAHGIINISVWTNSKPKIHENLQADFGNSWLRAIGWREAVNALSGSLRQDLDLVQTILSAVFTRSGPEVDALIEKVLGRIEDLKAETQMIGKVSMSQMASTRDRILTSTRDVSLYITRLLKQQQDFAGKGIPVKAEKWRQDVMSYISCKVRIACTYAEATPTAYRIHLRNTQKKALRAWWSVIGLPQQRPVSVVGKETSRSSGGRTKKPVRVR